MNGKYVFPVILFIIALIVACACFFAYGHNIGLLDPQGVIAHQERGLIIGAATLMLLVIIPVFVLTFGIAWHYRANNVGAEYRPNWEHHLVSEFVWWAIPMTLIAMLAVVTWYVSHTLDPFRPLVSTNPPLTVEVVSLDWKWLFIYPDQGIASVNYLAIPEKTPIAFKLTSDAPMNAFWIPQLGGMEMTMPGMITQIHLMSDATGTYEGFSSNISGAGFAGMHFPVYAMSANDFDAWVARTRQSPTELSFTAYKMLAQPSQNNPAAFYRVTDPRLYTEIVMQFMTPLRATSSMTMPMHP